jgi:hypothetical protein
MFNLINFKEMNTTVNVKYSLIALAIGLTVISCGGGGGKKQQNSNVSETTNEAKTTASQNIKSENYTEGATAKMNSLGKTEKDRRIVTVALDKEDRTTYKVYTYANGKCTDYSEYVFFTTKSDKSDFDYEKTRARTGEAGEEINEADLWFHVVWERDERSWKELYDLSKEKEGYGGNKVVE